MEKKTYSRYYRLNWPRERLEEIPSKKSRLESKSEAEVPRAIIRFGTVNAIPQLLAWGAVYWYFGLQATAGVLFVWTGVTVVVALAYFIRPSNLRGLLRFQFAGVLAINAAATYFLGGLFQAYGQFLWGFLVPMGALIVFGPREAIGWFLVYTTILFGFVPLSTDDAPRLPAMVGQLMTALNFLITGTFIFFAMYYFLARKNHFYELLRLEEQKSENLLLNILPKSIADQLKDSHGSIAASYDTASVLFLDLVGFTTLAARLGPDATVDMLNAIFSQFDDLVDRYRLEKIKTIGDSYMVAAGLPDPRDDHATSLVDFALELSRVTETYAREADEAITFRTGIHSGPVTAGVIGKRKFVFDVWGDTVNTASRMESHGVQGKVQISDDTYKLLDDRFECELRGNIEIKGKGTMRTWLVVGRRQPSGPQD